MGRYMSTVKRVTKRTEWVTVVTQYPDERSILEAANAPGARVLDTDSEVREEVELCVKVADEVELNFGGPVVRGET